MEGAGWCSGKAHLDGAARDNAVHERAAVNPCLAEAEEVFGREGATVGLDMFGGGGNE